MTDNIAPQQGDCAEARIALGVYVLGAIDPAERVLVDAHLATCEACQAELAELAELPALLALVPTEEAIALGEGLPGDDLFGEAPVITLPPDLQWPANSWHDTAALAPDPVQPAGEPSGQVAEVHDLSAARRRRRLARIGAVAAAAVVIGAAGFGGVRLGSSPPARSATPPGSLDQHSNGQPNGPWETVQGSRGQFAATVAYRSMGWGTQMDALVTGIPVNTPCQMWVVEASGTRIEVGGWSTDAAEGTVWYPASAFVPTSEVKAFVITVSGGQPITVMPA